MSYRRLKDEDIFGRIVRVKKKTFLHGKDTYVAEWEKGKYTGDHYDKDDLVESLKRLSIGNMRKNNLSDPELPSENFDREDIPTFGIADRVNSFTNRRL